MPDEYDKAHYNIYSIAFDAATMSFGDTLHCVYDAASLGLSASFPRVSPDGRFLAFTRRDDGLYTRLYISHIDGDGNASKPFMLPQKDPARYYKELMYSYNLPQFMSGRVEADKRKIADEMRNSAGVDVGLR